MKKIMIAANWKMHNNVHESSLLAHQLARKIKVHRDIEVVLAPTLLALQPLSLELDHRQFKLAAQNAYFKDEGAYTGEISFAMLRNIADYCIVGHSERRIYFNESLETVRDKVKAAVRNGITPILCVGENKHERDEGETKQVLHDQVTTAVSDLTSSEIEKIVIAYEPVWAISTFGGELAKPSTIKIELDYVRKQVEELYGAKSANNITILYGGSVDDQTAGGYLELDGCNGCLVGGASLSADKFAGIVAAAYRLQTRAG